MLPPHTTESRGLWAVTIGAVTIGAVTIAALVAVVIAFGRFRSNERVARAMAAGAARRRRESDTSPPEETDRPAPPCGW